MKVKSLAIIASMLLSSTVFSATFDEIKYNVNVIDNGSLSYKATMTGTEGQELPFEAWGETKETINCSLALYHGGLYKINTKYKSGLSIKLLPLNIKKDSVETLIILNASNMKNAIPLKYSDSCNIIEGNVEYSTLIKVEEVRLGQKKVFKINDKMEIIIEAALPTQAEAGGSL